jgi:hypothetical protein
MTAATETLAGEAITALNIGANQALLSNGSNGDSVPASVPALGRTHRIVRQARLTITAGQCQS